MAKALPPLTWFRSFEAAARHLNFTAAAEEIGLTQSAVSQQVKSLELRLRVPLFVRQPRGLALTDDGRRLLPQVTAAMGTLAAAARTFDAGPTESLLTVATSVSIAQWIISPNLADFTARHPGVRIRLLSAIWPDDFHSARADVEVRFGAFDPTTEGAIQLMPDQLVPLKAPSLRGPLEQLPLIEAVGTSDGWQTWQERHGGSQRPTCYADTYGMALQMAAHGNGVALVSAFLAEFACQSGMVERAHPGSVPATEGYSLFTRNAAGPAALFRDWLLALVPGAEGISAI